MKRSTIKTIIILVALLFINIEAANAGLISKLKLYIHHEFSMTELFYYSLGLITLSFVSYVIAAPVSIGREKASWMNYYRYSPLKYQYKRETVRKITEILSNR